MFPWTEDSRLSVEIQGSGGLGIKTPSFFMSCLHLCSLLKQNKDEKLCVTRRLGGTVTSWKVGSHSFVVEICCLKTFITLFAGTYPEKHLNFYIIITTTIIIILYLLLFSFLLVNVNYAKATARNAMHGKDDSIQDFPSSLNILPTVTLPSGTDWYIQTRSKW